MPTLKSSRERKVRINTEIRKRIINEAVKITSKQGWENVTARKMAEKVEYSTIKIYSEFGNMEALMLEVQKIGFIKLHATLKKAAATKADPVARLLNISKAMWGFGKKDPYLYQVMYGFNGVICPVNPTAEMDQIRELIKTSIRDVAGYVTNSLSFNWWALIHGYIHINMVNDKKYGPGLDVFVDESLKRYIDTIKQQLEK